MQSICIVRLSALGDVLMLVPLVRTLQKYLPGVSLTWVISRPAYELVEGIEGVEFIVIDKPRGWRDYWRFKQQLRGRHFDVLLAAQASFRANVLYPCISATRKIGYDPLRAKDGQGWVTTEVITPGEDHTVDGFLKFAAPLGVVDKDIRWDLPIPDASIVWARAQLPEGSVVLINPAASKPERSWLVERYVAVIKQIQCRWQLPVVLIGGPDHYDESLGNAIAAEVPVRNLIGQTNLKQLLAVIAQGRLLICPDTGPSHMATAVGTPVVALHAVTSSAVSGPYLCRHWAVDCYPEAVRQRLQSTAPAWGSHIHGPKTMRLVTVEAVMIRLTQILG